MYLCFNRIQTIYQHGDPSQVQTYAHLNQGFATEVHFAALENAALSHF